MEKPAAVGPRKPAPETTRQAVDALSDAELDEVIRCSHRVVVLRDGETVGELVGDEIDERQIMHTIAGR